MSMAIAATALNAVGTISSARSSRRAAQAQENAANNATALSEMQYEQNRQDMAPWREAGAGALSQLNTGTAAGGDLNRDFTLADFNRDPGYQFRMDEGARGLEASAAARGGALGGGSMRALERYRQGFASSEYQNSYNRFNADRDRRFNRLASVAGIGQTATRDVAQMGTDAANRQGEYGMQGANARASGYIGRANALSGGLGSLSTLGQIGGWGGGFGGGIGSSGWQMGGPNGTNDRGTFSTGTNYDWWLRNGSGGD